MRVMAIISFCRILPNALLHTEFSFLSYIKISRPSGPLLNSMWHVTSSAFTKFRDILRSPVHFIVKRIKGFVWKKLSQCENEIICVTKIALLYESVEVDGFVLFVLSSFRYQVLCRRPHCGTPSLILADAINDVPVTRDAN